MVPEVLEGRSLSAATAAAVAEFIEASKAVPEREAVEGRVSTVDKWNLLRFDGAQRPVPKNAS